MHSYKTMHAYIAFKIIKIKKNYLWVCAKAQ